MEVGFRTTSLRRCYQDFARGSKMWGPKIARAYIGRLGLHQLKGRREGQHAIDLEQQWRMMITYIEAEAKIVVIEVTNHYDD